MDYKMTVSMMIDTEAKKNTFRNTLKSDLETQFANGNLSSWNMSVEGVLVDAEDSENYSSEE